MPSNKQISLSKKQDSVSKKQNSVSKKQNSVSTKQISSSKKSLGATLILSLIFGFLGIDRFYLGGKQIKYGALTLFGSIIIIGIPINILVIFLTQLSIICAIFGDRTNVLLYGDTVFEKPTLLDKLIMIFYIIFFILIIFFSGIISLIIGY